MVRRLAWQTFLAAALILAVGVGLGILITRVVKPPGDASNAFVHLGTEGKEEVALLVAASYARHGDVAQAQAQLERLQVPNVQQWIADVVHRCLAAEPESADTRALVVLAEGLGVRSRPVLAYRAALTPWPSHTPLPTWTPSATNTPAATAVMQAEEVSTTSASVTPPLPATNTPQPPPSGTPEPSPSPTSTPQATITPRPQPSATAQPASTPATKWSWTARLVSPGQEGQSCADGHKLIRVTVLDAGGAQLPGVWVHERYTGWYRVTGHKGEDPFWGPGEVELSNLDGGQVCIATGEGGGCESELTRSLPCHDPPPFEDLWAAGFCDCCEPGIAKDACRVLFESGRCLGIAHYAWRLEFRRSW